jgi:hypothetical protein
VTDEPVVPVLGLTVPLVGSVSGSHGLGRHVGAGELKVPSARHMAELEPSSV